MDDVAGHSLPLVVSERSVVAIEFLHRREISVTHANDDNRAWVLGKLVDQVLGSRHVMDSAVREEKKDLVRLLTLHGSEHS